MKPLKTRSKPNIWIWLLLSMVKSLWKSYKKTHEIHKNKVLLRYFNYVPIEHKNFDNYFS